MKTVRVREFVDPNACDMLRGPCACGAWHDGGDAGDARQMIALPVPEVATVEGSVTRAEEIKS